MPTFRLYLTGQPGALLIEADEQPTIREGLQTFSLVGGGTVSVPASVVLRVDALRRGKEPKPRVPNTDNDGLDRALEQLEERQRLERGERKGLKRKRP